MQPFIRLESVEWERPGGRVEPEQVRGVSLQVERGEFVCILGSAKSGKSALLGLLAGLARPTGGTVLLEGVPLVGPRPDVAMVFQGESLLPWLTVRENVFVAVDAVHGELMPLERKFESTEYHLRIFGLWPDRHRYPNAIDRAARGRVSLARAFAVRPRLLLLDEPFAAQDPTSRARLRDVVHTLLATERRRRPQTVVLSTTEVEEAILMGERVAVLRPGEGATLRAVVPIWIQRGRAVWEIVRDPDFTDLKQRLELLLCAHQTGLQHPGADPLNPPLE